MCRLVLSQSKEEVQAVASLLPVSVWGLGGIRFGLGSYTWVKARLGYTCRRHGTSAATGYEVQAVESLLPVRVWGLGGIGFGLGSYMWVKPPLGHTCRRHGTSAATGYYLLDMSKKQLQQLQPLQGRSRPPNYPKPEESKP